MRPCRLRPCPWHRPPSCPPPPQPFPKRRPSFKTNPPMDHPNQKRRRRKRNRIPTTRLFRPKAPRVKLRRKRKRPRRISTIPLCRPKVPLRPTPTNHPAPNSPHRPPPTLGLVRPGPTVAIIAPNHPHCRPNPGPNKAPKTRGEPKNKHNPHMMITSPNTKSTSFKINNAFKECSCVWP